MKPLQVRELPILTQPSDTVSGVDAFDSLCRSCLCDGLPLEEIEWLAARSSPIRLETDEVLFDDDDRIGAIHVVARGEVSLLVRGTAAGEFAECARLAVGQFIGEGAVIDTDGAQGAGAVRRARIVARCETVVLRIDAAAFLELVDRQPRLMVRNLLRHSAEKNRLASRVVLEERLERESVRIFQDLSRWLIRSVEDAATALRLNAELLRDERSPARQAATVDDLNASARDLVTTLGTLGQLGGASTAVPAFEVIRVREWWGAREADLRERLVDRRIELDAYVEDCALTSCPELLGGILLEMFDGLSQLLDADRRIEMRVGRKFGAVEFRLSLWTPGLTEYAANRLFRPFALGEDEMPFQLSLARRNARFLGGDASVQRRDGDRLTLLLSLPLTPIHGR
jgi:CRP-like cAMP-binding protein